MSWNYWVVVHRPYSDLENPRGLLRQRPGADRYDAQALTRFGTWDPSDLPARIWLGKEYVELEPVSREVAAGHARRWKVTGAWTAMPDDLTDDPVPASSHDQGVQDAEPDTASADDRSDP